MRAPSRLMDLKPQQARMRPMMAGWRQLLGVVVLASSGMAAPAYAQSSASQWTLAKGLIPYMGATELCLTTGGSRSGGRAHWKAIINPAASKACTERFRVDLYQRQLYFDFHPSFRWAEGDIPGEVAEPRCNRGARGRGYTPCTSRFFDREAEAGRRDGSRSLNREKLFAALTSAGAFEALETFGAAQRAAADRDRWATYAEEFERATTLEDIASFERRYEMIDKDGLIPKLQLRKQRLLHDQYVAAFNAAITPVELTSFIDRYGHDDPDRLVPKAREKIALLQARERALEKARRDREAAATLAEARQAKRADDQRRLAWCKRSMAEAYATLERERRIEATSGVQNLTVRRRAGETIVYCQQVIGRGY